MGATAAKILLPVGQDGVESFADSVQLVAHTAEQAYRVGLPLMVEPALWGPKVEEHGDELIAHASRVAVELGAALLKIPAPRNDPTLSAIVENSPIPVYVLGGTPAGAGSLAQELSRCISNGITGVVVGRNVWSRPRPRKAVEGLAAAVHHGDMNGCQKLLEEADEG
jgi:DhnA family fructose-bisphosphate aldolase class Ia